MQETVDVGSVLGGRYRVTAHILASTQQDLVLDGVDQVLNRPVSILVASEANAGKVAAGARDLATGDRDENIQVLDLLTTEGATSLVTNRTSAANLLKLIVQPDAPVADEPFVEPFFTDTLGLEIFGTPRSTEPETYGHDDTEDDEYDYDDERGSRWSGLAGLRRRFSRRPEDEHDDAPGLPPVEAAPPTDSRPTSHLVPPPPTSRPTAYRSLPDEPPVPEAAAAAAVGSSIVPPPDQEASRFPFFADQDDEPDTSDADTYSDDQDENRDEDTRGGGFTRVLLGAVLSVILVIAVVLVATQLSSLFRGTETAAEQAEQATSAPTDQAPTTTPPSAPADPGPEVVEPVIAGITRVVPDNPALDAGNDANLPLIIDGDPATFWGNQVYASDAFGGLASNLALVVELKDESGISEVTIDQLNGSGGSFTVLVNDEPTLDGAEEIAQGSFTSPTVTLPIPAGTDGPPTGRYVIVNFTQLPRLSDIQAQFPFGLRIAEIGIA